MRNRDSHTFPHLTLSLLTHAALASIVTLAPMLQPLPEGTVSTMEVEFTALTPPPLGQQLKTIDVGQQESEAPAQPTNVHPDVKELPVPKNSDSVAVVAPPMKTKPLAKPSNKPSTTPLEEFKSAEKLKIKPTETPPVSPPMKTPPAQLSAQLSSQLSDKKLVATNDSPVELLKPSELPEKTVDDYSDDYANNSTDKNSDQDFLKNDLAEMNDRDNLNDNRFSDPSDISGQPDFSDPSDSPDHADHENEKTVEKKLESELLAVKNSDVTTETAQQQEMETTSLKPTETTKEIQPAPPALTQGLPQKSQELRHESNMNYGVPTGVRDYRELVQIPGNVPPQYPELSRRKKEMGQVKLMYFVTSSGTVSSMQLTQSSGHEALDYEAIRAISKYKYQPGQQGRTSHTVNFMLRGDAKEAGGTLRTSSHQRKNSHPNN